MSIKTKLLNKMLINKFGFVGEMWTKLFLALVFVANVLGKTRVDPLVQSKSGLIRGMDADDGNYSIFLGVPYASVDKDDPFGPAKTNLVFDGVFDAIDDSSVCPQIDPDSKSSKGAIDCLHLNIYVPKTAKSSNKLPVIAWIHGGSFTHGSAGQSKFGPKFIVKHNVILVTMNYRVGLYGFLCLGTPDAPGNQGLKDQVIALRWIKENIVAFGGDPNKVTIMGESAGSAAVEFHLMSQQEKLFDKAILQSGSNLKPGGLMQVDKTPPLRVAKKLGLKTDNVTEAMSFLKQVNPHLVVKASIDLEIGLRGCVENELEKVEPIITEHFLNIEMPKLKDTPILAGFNSREGLKMDNDKDRNYFKNSNYFNDTLKLAFDYDEDFKEKVDIVRRFYTGDEALTEDIRNSIIDFEGDYYYGFPVQWSLKIYLERGAARVYQYLFSYEGGRNLIKNKQNITHAGASHADELGYLFNGLNDKNTQTLDDQLVIDRMTTMWTNFVKYGDPTPEVTELLPFHWTPFSVDTYTYLNIDRDFSLKNRPFHQRMSFWELFYKTNMQRLKKDIVKIDA